jgi:AcrR family transcriptional regulator
MNVRSSSEPARQGKGKGRGKLRERIRATTVQAIMESAEEVFADQGLHSAHMGDIAARAGVAVGTLYNHFQDREALLAGLLDARRADLLAGIDRRLAETARRPFAERLQALLASVLEHKQAHRRFFHILLQGEIGRYHLTFPSTSHKPSATMGELFDRVERIIKQGVRDKHIRRDAAELAPVLFVGMVRAVGIRDLLDRRTPDIASESRHLIDLFLRGTGT